MEALIFLVLLFWISSGIFSYGYGFAYLQRKYPTLADENYIIDRSLAGFMALFGPVNLGVLFFSGRCSYGVKWK